MRARGFSHVPIGAIRITDSWPRPKYLEDEPESDFGKVAFLLQEYVGWGECPATHPFCKNADCYCKLPNKIMAIFNR